MDDMARRVGLIRDLSSRLGHFLAGLSREEWTRPSACELWEVREVVAHLTGGAERQIQSMVRGRKGDAAPPPGFAPLDVAALSASNAQRDIAMRERLGNALLDAFVTQYDRLGQLLAQFGPVDWETLCWHARRGAMPAREYVDLRIQELAIHDWDIRSAFEPEPHLAPESLPILVNMTPTWLGMSFRPGPRLAAPVLYRFQVSGAAPSRHEVVVKGDAFKVRPAAPSKADVALHCDAETYLLFLYGRVPAARGFTECRLAIDGDFGLVERFEQWFKGL